MLSLSRDGLQTKFAETSEHCVRRRLRTSISSHFRHPQHARTWSCRFQSGTWGVVWSPIDTLMWKSEPGVHSRYRFCNTEVASEGVGFPCTPHLETPSFSFWETSLSGINFTRRTHGDAAGRTVCALLTVSHPFPIWIPKLKNVAPI